MDLLPAVKEEQLSGRNPRKRVIERVKREFGPYKPRRKKPFVVFPPQAEPVTPKVPRVVPPRSHPKQSEHDEPSGLRLALARVVAKAKIQEEDEGRAGTDIDRV